MIRILLAEDDNSMREYLARALERVGYAVTAVDRGTAALPLLETQSFDLLLTDIVMPEMDGIELAQRAAVIAPGMRVMFITGFAAVALKGGAAPANAQDPVQAVPPARSRRRGRPHVPDRRGDRALGGLADAPTRRLAQMRLGRGGRHAETGRPPRARAEAGARRPHRQPRRGEQPQRDRREPRRRDRRERRQQQQQRRPRATCQR